jgi:hypothetical protein
MLWIASAALLVEEREHSANRAPELFEKLPFGIDFYIKPHFLTHTKVFDLLPGHRTKNVANCDKHQSSSVC